MNEQKFRAKLQMLIEYEDAVYAEFLELIKPYNEELKKQSCEIFCCLIWQYSNDSEEFGVKKERGDFNKKEGYLCDIILQFQSYGTNYYDCDENEGIGFQIFSTITKYGVSLFRGNNFFKYGTSNLKKLLRQVFLKVQKLGLEKASKEIRGL